MKRLIRRIFGGRMNPDDFVFQLKTLSMDSVNFVSRATTPTETVTVKVDGEIVGHLTMDTPSGPWRKGKTADGTPWEIKVA